MCGWVGVFGATATEAALRRASATLATRGPDGSGERVVDNGPMLAGMAHRRLAILDPTPAGAQPMYDEERGVSVVYNGEIYNSPALRRELEKKGVRFRSGTDTEVLLLGWAEWGDAVLQRIEGMFSFALVDERRGRALLARDRMGVKPLYWAELDGTLIAASAPRAILSLRPELRAGLDRIALAQFLTLLWIPHPRTPWTAIKKLQPATALSLEGGRIKHWRYWPAPEPRDVPLDPLELRDHLEEATARQLMSDVPIGLLLSGGLDSTLLLALMARNYNAPKLSAFSARYGSEAQRLEIAPDDTCFAQLAASHHPSVELNSVEIDHKAGGDLDALAPYFDDPVADPAAITLYRLCQASDSKVLLSGVGGEELFAGYPRHEVVDLARNVARLPWTIRCGLATGSSLLSGGRGGPLHAVRRNTQKLARAVSDQRPAHYWRMTAQLSYNELQALVPDAAESAYDELDAQSSPLASCRLTNALAFDRNQFLPNLNLAYVDKASMAAGVEVRVPLLDEIVVAQAYSADPSRFMAGGTTKAPLRAAAAGLVPDAIIHRQKAGFGAPIKFWFRSANKGPLRERIQDLAGCTLVDQMAATTISRNATSGRQDNSLAAWALINLQAWQAAHG